MRGVPKGVLKPTTNQFLPETSVLYYWSFLYGIVILKAIPNATPMPLSLYPVEAEKQNG
jgi:hypothetical protein